jgi:hypothetical protein
MCEKCPPKFPRKNRKNATKGSADSAVCASGEAVAKPLGNTAESSTTYHSDFNAVETGKDRLFHTNPKPTGERCSGKKTDAKSYDRRAVRAERYRIQAIIAQIFMREGQRLGLRYADDYHRTAQCLRKPYASDVNVNRSKAHDVAFYGGLQQCASPACPVCTAKVQERRRLEIAEAFEYAYKRAKKKIIMVTLTFPHAISDRLKDQQTKLKDALKKLRQGNSYTLMKKRIGYDGLIRSLEVMYGSNGWHSHTHEAWIVDWSTDVVELREWLTRKWHTSCVNSGLISEDYAKTDSFQKHAVQIIDECKSSDYLAKHDGGYWGADRELASASSKGTINSNKKTIHPFDLIKLYEETGDEKYAELFVEYAEGIKGSTPVYWSPGLKAKVGLKDKTDKEIVEEKEDKSYLLAMISYVDWKLIVKAKARAKILDLAESEGIKGIFEYIEVLRI